MEFAQALELLAAIAAELEARAVGAEQEADDQAARPLAGEVAEAIPPATIVVQARTGRARGVWRPQARRSGPRERWPAVWRWMRAEARRVLGSRRRPGGEGEARGPPGSPPTHLRHRLSGG